LTDRDDRQKVINANKYMELMYGDRREAKGLAKPEIKELKPKRKWTKSEGPSEHDEQVKVVHWWWQQGRAWGFPVNALFAVPNAQALIKFANNPNAFLVYLQKEGMRKGALDLILAIPAGKFHGMFLEMKKETGGVVSEEQQNFVGMLQDHGYSAGVHRGGDAAIAAITAYLGK
jgi:hypothetical protein